MNINSEYRRIADTGIQVSPVAMGCWPIAGMTSLGVNQADSLTTLQAAFDHGVNFFDTAYCYGAAGESERLIAKALGPRRDDIVIATKGGIHWNEAGQRVFDARPETLRRECEASLRRLNTDRVELLYLHAPDPDTPLSESAGELRRLMDEGKTRSVGVSNFSLPQLEAFQAVCPITACQPPYNMLQRQIERDTLPWCRERGVAVMVYWPLMKGLLAGRLPRDHVFAAGDGRAKYPMFQGDQWQKNQDFVDQLRDVAGRCGKTVAQVVVNWTIHQAGITVALCGAKRPEQIIETAGAMGWRLTPPQLAQIDAALAARGEPIVGSAV
ncbi:MAG: aldo/keto reductase [Planctomycetes bacterium]|nr:aldo/keto reductase [Planctomycetota bacterium]